MKISLKLILIIAFTLTIAIKNSFSQQWPIENQSQQQRMVGTIGEDRNNLTRFHKGADVPGAIGTEVYTIEAGTVNLIGNSTICIGDYCYTHLTNLQYVEMEEVPESTFIGVTNCKNHIHLQKFDNGTENLTSIHSNIAWSNPLNSLTPFVDNVAPDIDTVTFWRETNTANQYSEITGNTLYGEIDILVNSEDPRVSSIGNADGGGCSPYKMYWETFRDGELIRRFSGIEFRRAPNNNSSSIVFSPNSSYLTPNFEHYITKDPFNTPYDKHWNIVQRDQQGYEVDSRFPSESILPEGDSLEVKVYSCDIRNNCDTSIHFYTIDNFQPFIKEFELYQDNQLLSKSYWETSECGGISYNENSSQELLNKAELYKTGLKIKVITSEPLNNFKLNIPILNKNDIQSAETATNTYEFETGPIQTINLTGDLTVVFSGIDDNNNDLLTLDSHENNNCLVIPIKDDNGSWNNPSNINQQTETLYKLPCFLIEISSPLITQPSACDAEDGLIDFKTGTATGGIGSYTGIWTNSAGDVIPNDPNYNWTRLTNLPSDTYYLALTDAVGCTANAVYEVFAIDATQIITDVSEPCSNTANGLIEVVAFNPLNNDALFNFEWSNGNTTNSQDHSIIENIPSGTYTVTITEINGSCTLIETFTLMDLDEVTPIEITSIVVNNCPNENNGEIEIEITGGRPDYSIVWTNNLHGKINKTLAPGAYSVTVTDYCLSTETIDFIIAPINGSLDLTIGCRDEGEISCIVSGGNPPYTYNWSNGSNNADLSNLSSGVHSVTVYDENACSLVLTEEIRNIDYNRIDVLPCEGFNEGETLIEIHNPNLEDVTLEFQSGILVELGNESHIEYSLNELLPNVTYEIKVNIGECQYNENFQIESKPTEKTFSHEEEDVCYYDEFCDGDLILEDGHQTNAWFNFAQASGGWLTPCYIPGFCKIEGEWEEQTRKNYSKKTVSGGEYLRVLNLAFTNSPFPSIYIQQLIDNYNSRNFNPCSRIRYCPANLKRVSSATVFKKVSAPTFVPPDCWYVDCPWPQKNYTYCDSDIIPDYFIDSDIGNGAPDDCDPRQYRVYQIVKWHDELITNYADYMGSSLYDVIIEVLDDPELLQKSKCADIIFCKKNFLVISNNIQSIDCDFYTSAGVEVNSCESIYYETTTGNEIVSCAKPCGFDSWCTYPTFITGNLDNFNFFSPPNPDNLSVNKLISGETGATSFERFNYSYIAGEIVPKAQYKEGIKNVHNEFTHFGWCDENNETNQIVGVIEDWDNDNFTFIEKIGQNNYQLYFEGLNTNWEKTFSSTEILDIEQVRLENQVIHISGNTSGNLVLQNNQIGSSVDRVSFELKIEEDGTYYDLSMGSKLSANTITKFNLGGNNIRSFGTTTGLKDKMKKTVFSTTTSFGETPYEKSVFSMSNSVSLIEANSNESFESFLFQGNGNIESEINSDVFSISEGESLLLITNSSGDVINTHRISHTLGAIDNPIIKFGNLNELYMGINFSGEINVNGQSIISSGEFDILFMTVNLDKSLSHFGLKYFGSASNELMKDFYISNSLIYFGGDMHGVHYPRQIGNVKYYHLLSNLTNAFTSYTSAYGFEIYPTSYNAEFVSTRTKNVNEKIIKVYPTVFNNNIIFEIESKTKHNLVYTIFNTLGEKVQNGEVSLEKGKNIEKITSIGDLSNGIYFVGFNNINSVYKIIKVDQ